VKFLLDTDHISILQLRSGLEYAQLIARMAQHPPADFVLSVVSFQEQVLGANNYISQARNPVDLIRGYSILDDVLAVFRAMTVLSFDAAAAATYSGLITQRLRVPTMDLRIAAIALSRGSTVLTRNLRDFRRVPNLNAEDWTV
jgi:tRNA(fMet)-specific endonuclease VapC